MRGTKTGPSETGVVAAGRFKLLPVTSRISIKDFVNRNGVSFQPGRGFYQLTKPETIQAYKEIVAVRVSDGLQVTGDKVRELLKIPKGAKKFKYAQVPDFEVFVQSTSYNRVLMPNTKFLYEVNPSTKVVSKESRGAPPPPTSAGSAIDLVFSFDTTGSMYSCLGEVRKNLQAMITRILSDIPNIRIAVFAHGDYCDSSTYVTKFIDFSTDTAALVNFVKNVEATGGGDYPECYELVLKEVRQKLSWRPGSQRSLVMIGDAIPHTVASYPSIMRCYPFVKEIVDWRKEADELLDIGCRIYAVQCNGHSSDSDNFWAGLAYKTYGHHLHLANFSNVFDFIMAIAYREQGPEQLEAYRQEVMARAGPSGSGGSGGLNSELHALFNSLVDDPEDGAASAAVDVAAPDVALPTAAAALAPPTAGSKRKAGSSTAPSPAKRPKTAGPTKTAVRRTTASKKAPAKKAPVKKAPAKKAPVKKAPAKKGPVKKAPAKKAPVKTAPVKAKGAATTKVVANKAATKKPAARKPAASKPAAKKPATKKAATKRATTGKTAAASKAAAGKRAAASKKPAARKPAAKKPATKKPATRKPVKKTPRGKGGKK